MPTHFKSEQDLKDKIVYSLTRHFKSQQAAEPVAAVGRMLPLLCDRTPHLGDFALSFDRAPAGAPQLYILHGRDEDRLGSCVERLVCLNILRPQRTLAPATASRAVDFPWPDPDEPESLAMRRFPYVLFPLLNDRFIPNEGDANDLCRLGLTCGAKYILFRHVMTTRRWNAATQKFFFGAYLRFWDSVAVTYAQSGSDPAMPRFLIFLEFKDGAGESANFRSDLQTSLELRDKETSGSAASKVHLLPRLRDVEGEHLETWLRNFGKQMIDPYRGRTLEQLFPATPLPMSNVEDELSKYLGFNS